MTIEKSFNLSYAFTWFSAFSLFVRSGGGKQARVKSKSHRVSTTRFAATTIIIIVIIAMVAMAS
ncbi:hypothetical protein DF182_17420 [Chitinophaga flava]|uniref:Uncharacterized protein n=2 Tax=Chitinophaga flava TaxID=2259036 RepID=A0A365XPU8_9BACT|nr:hypothetical protein DF182_17420 [Chitinophaga flava]